MISFKATTILLTTLCFHISALAQINYSKKIKEIAERAVDMTYIYAPMGFKEFEVLYKQPEIYLDSAIKYLKRPNYEQLEFSVVSLSMCELKPEKFLTFIESCFESYYDGKIDDNTMGLVLGGVFGNPFIRDNHNNDKVQDLLKKLIDNKKSSADTKSRAIEYKNGKVLKSHEGPNPMFRSKEEMDNWGKMDGP